jgi:hypothetical protein
VSDNFAWTLTLNQWNHLAFVRISGVCYAYVNGVLASSGTPVNAPNITGTQLAIGSSYTNFFTFKSAGSISNVRIVKGVGIYTGNFIPPKNILTTTQDAGVNIRDITGTQTVLLLKTPNTGNFITDSSVNNFTFTNVGSVISQTLTPIPVTSVASGSIIPPSLSLISGSSIPTFVNNSWFKNLIFTGNSSTPATTTVLISGDLTLSTGGTYTGLTVFAAGTGNYTSTGKTIPALYVNTTGTATLTDAMNVSSVINLLSGTFNLASFNATSVSFLSSGTSTRAVTGSGTYSITGSGSTVFYNTNPTGITMSGVIVSLTSASAKTFAGGGGSYATLNQGGSGLLTISGDNSFADITATTRPSTITFTASSTQTFTAFTLSGTAGNYVTINSSSPGTRFNLSSSSTVNVDYLSIQDSNATGGGSWYAGANSINAGNNLGWIFTVAVQNLGNFFLFF